jgi:hypothetical protein
MSSHVQVELNPVPRGRPREPSQLDRQFEIPALYPDANLEFNYRTSAPVTWPWLALAMGLGTLMAFTLLELARLGIGV